VDASDQWTPARQPLPIAADTRRLRQCPRPDTSRPDGIATWRSSRSTADTAAVSGSPDTGHCRSRPVGRSRTWTQPAADSNADRLTSAERCGGRCGRPGACGSLRRLAAVQPRLLVLVNPLVVPGPAGTSAGRARTPDGLPHRSQRKGRTPATAAGHCGSDAIGQRMAGLAVVITAYGVLPSPGRSIRSLVTAPSSLTGRSGCR
jgi:hypothetical protein